MVISVPEGLELLNKKITQPFKILTGTIDDHLNDKSCKIPRLGVPVIFPLALKFSE